MPINSSGKISFTDIAAEHGGQKPYSASAYLRGGALVTGTPAANAEIPTTNSDIQFSDYYGSKSTIQITYEIQGGGGAGGGGYNDRGDNSGTANNGGDSSITYGVTTITATGGGGGEHGGNGRDQPGTDGEDSHYGDGGAGGARNTAGSSAAASSYGAGGGGGGGDDDSYQDRSGAAGTGGFAGQRVTGTAEVENGTSITYMVGAKGAGGAGTPGNYVGGSGASGYIKITKEGNVDIVDGTDSGSVTLT